MKCDVDIKKVNVHNLLIGFIWKYCFSWR